MMLLYFPLEFDYFSGWSALQDITNTLALSITFACSLVTFQSSMNLLCKLKGVDSIFKKEKASINRQFIAWQVAAVWTCINALTFYIGREEGLDDFYYALSECVTHFMAGLMPIYYTLWCHYQSFKPNKRTRAKSISISSGSVLTKLI